MVRSLRRSNQSNTPVQREPRPLGETIMQRAFLRALLKGAARGDRKKSIALPTGRVDPAELVRVVTALKCAMAPGRKGGGRGIGRRRGIINLVAMAS
jgi:hypothetical protein